MKKGFEKIVCFVLIAALAFAFAGCGKQKGKEYIQPALATSTPAPDTVSIGLDDEGRLREHEPKPTPEPTPEPTPVPTPAPTPVPVKIIEEMDEYAITLSKTSFVSRPDSGMITMTVEPDTEILITGRTASGYFQAAVGDSDSYVLTNQVYFAMDKTMYATAATAVLAKPETGSTEFGTLNAGDEIHVIGIMDSGWFYVEFNENRGFVAENFLSDVQPVAATPQVLYNNSYVSGSNTAAVAEKAEYDTKVLSLQVNIPVSEANKIWREYLKVPVQIRELFEKNAYKIIVTDKNISSVWNGDVPQDANSGFSKQNGGVWIKYSEGCEAIVCHAFGHAAWGMDSDIIRFDDPEYSAMDIFYLEKETFAGNRKTAAGNTQSVEEYFAEAFSVYCREYPWLMNHCPQSHNYIVYLINTADYILETNGGTEDHSFLF